MLIQQKTDGIGKLHHITDALCHTCNASGGQQQTVQHHVGNRTLCLFKIDLVGLQDLLFVAQQRSCHGFQCSIFLRGGQAADLYLCGFCGV